MIRAALPALALWAGAASAQSAPWVTLPANGHYPLDLMFNGAAPKDKLTKVICVRDMTQRRATQFNARLDNQPVSLKGKTTCDTVEFDRPIITVWDIPDDKGTLRGRDTTCVMLCDLRPS
ncbi:MAG: hypothetical protein AB8B51_17125 [Sedimentitalea sp.]